jgi:hypothetical protein
VDADGVAEGRKKTAGEELDPLRLVQTTCTWQEGLEPIGVFLHSACPPALR